MIAVPYIRPELRLLDLPDNKLGTEALQHVAHGSWPKLQELSLAGNPSSVTQRIAC